MFRPIDRQFLQAENGSVESRMRTIQFTFDGRTMRARSGDSLAASLLANGIGTFRETPVSGAKRGPYCLMGVCFDCLVVIDGVGNRQACLTPVRDGMIVETQRGVRNLDALERAGQ